MPSSGLPSQTATATGKAVATPPAPTAERAPARSNLTLDRNDKSTLLRGQGFSDLMRRQTNHRLYLTAHRGMGPTSVFGRTFPEDLPPENSIASIRQAMLQGADAVEVDIFKSGDGRLVVTHDDEIWRNAYDTDRTGQDLPAGETTDSYRIGQKTLAELQRIPIGPNGETMPTLDDVLELAQNVNETLKEAGRRGVILNIELKDKEAIGTLLNFLDSQKAAGRQDCLDNLIFCSFKHEALKTLRAEAKDRGISNLNIVPGIKTAQWFGDAQVDKENGFALRKEDAEYDKQEVEKLRKLVEDYDFQGYDGIIWDFRQDVLDLVSSSAGVPYGAAGLPRQGGTTPGEMVLHASTSDFRQYATDNAFSDVLLKLTEAVETFFKCDNIDDARKTILDSAIRSKGLQAQLLCRPTKDGGVEYRIYNYGHSDDRYYSALTHGAPKPVPFSKLKCIT
ncbi:hypothetical protein HW532_10550 [Kaustia mangrovi]|uniref:GP-PDE domain-containing protein n=1 Tax=Kaustia mangrovi TaxID=2593653 RepID=A0A7S8C481_9HYPH|nr:glycerophosphodiester phosphodiesterase family protein [Kaustia mangrovi]QPC43089.1 hypothetical protein HW532_10550 [Kaustia mangrovi]